MKCYPKPSQQGTAHIQRIFFFKEYLESCINIHQCGDIRIFFRIFQFLTDNLQLFCVQLSGIFHMNQKFFPFFFIAYSQADFLFLLHFAHHIFENIFN